MRRRMKHILGILLSLSLCCSMSLFSSCSADPTGAQTTDADDTKQIIAVSATQAASQLLAAGNWSEEMIPLKDSRIISVYGVNEADFAEKARKTDFNNSPPRRCGACLMQYLHLMC